ncbi:hypothetical protein EGYY_16030 [Eggerthella sp. YY7918]|nr:hypothetical protein EGYY_16030 [Eggerthella sp. YY7918]
MGVTEGGVIRLSGEALRLLGVQVVMELLAIRSSDIAFTMEQKAPYLTVRRPIPARLPCFDDCDT